MGDLMEIRKISEQNEKDHLSELATLSSESKGRVIPIDECEIRTCFQRDRDRIVHSKAFRRLKHKTQVFIAPEGDHYRTRLTHALEVSQISRTIARALRLNEDLAEAIALGHDLGHTPFGHAGEEVLEELHPGGFKHNEQSLRVVEMLEGDHGLNLTWEVRDGILCHTGEVQPSTMEGKIVRVSDRIAYINHDIDDALRGKVIEEDDVPLELMKVLGFTHKERINVMIMDLVITSQEKKDIEMSQKISDAMLGLREFMFDNVYIGSEAKREEKKAQRIIRELYLYYVEKYHELPEEYLNSISNKRDTIDRVVCDYIAGMTDNYAIKLFEKLFIPRSWETI